MSPDFFTAKFKKLSGKHIVIIGLLILHTVWIIAHLNLVSKGLINPWKLGGYGMYTKPNYKAKLRLYDVSSQPMIISRKSYKRTNFRNANLRYIFRCRKFTEEAFLVFFQDNPHLIKRNLRFVLREKEFTRGPIGVKRVVYSTAEIRWPRKDKFIFNGEICGTKYTGQAEYKAEYKAKYKPEN